MEAFIIFILIAGLVLGAQHAHRRSKVLKLVACPTCKTTGCTHYSRSRTLLVGGTLKTMRCVRCGYRW